MPSPPGPAVLLALLCLSACGADRGARAPDSVALVGAWSGVDLPFFGKQVTECDETLLVVRLRSTPVTNPETQVRMDWKDWDDAVQVAGGHSYDFTEESPKITEWRRTAWYTFDPCLGAASVGAMTIRYPDNGDSNVEIRLYDGELPADVPTPPDGSPRADCP